MPNSGDSLITFNKKPKILIQYEWNENWKRSIKKFGVKIASNLKFSQHHEDADGKANIRNVGLYKHTFVLKE